VHVILNLLWKTVYEAEAQKTARKRRELSLLTPLGSQSQHNRPSKIGNRQYLQRTLNLTVIQPCSSVEFAIYVIHPGAHSNLPIIPVGSVVQRRMLTAIEED